METAADQGVSPKESTAVAALAGVDEGTAALLDDCFRQFGISTVVVLPDELSCLEEQPFHACVLPLDESSEPVLATIRRSPHNAHSVVYGICGSVKQAMRYSGYGINAIFLRPVERQAALRVVRGTHLMVLREVRRYVRVPLVAAAALQTGTETVPASTVELSAGGASLYTPARLTVPQTVRVTLRLPNAGELSLGGIVCWIRRDEELAGVRFEPSDPRREQLREWIDAYVGDN